jgi:hypothetical protein
MNKRLFALLMVLTSLVAACPVMAGDFNPQELLGHYVGNLKISTSRGDETGKVDLVLKSADGNQVSGTILYTVSFRSPNTNRDLPFSATLVGNKLTTPTTTITISRDEKGRIHFDAVSQTSVTTVWEATRVD